MTFLKKLAYGSGDTPLALFFTVISIYLLFFLTDVAGIPAALAGWVLAAGKLWDAFTDPVIGHLSDKTKSSWGRRRPYLLSGAPLLALTFIALWQPYPVDSVVMRFLIYMAISIAFSTAFAVVAVPYAALAPELTLDYDERTALISFRMLFSLVMGIAAAALPGFFLNVPADRLAGGFSRMGIILGLLGILPSFIVVVAVRERYHEKAFETFSIWRSYRDILRNRAFIITVGIYLLTWVPMDIIAAVMVYYMKYVMHREDMLNMLLLTLFGTAALCLPLWNMVSSHMEKNRAYMVGGAIIVATILPLAFLPFGAPLWLLFVIGAGAGVGISAAHLFPWALIPECIDYDEVRHGIRREGLYTGFFSFSQKLASSLAIVVVGSVLSWMGYHPGIAQSPRTLLAIRILCGLLPAVFFTLSVILASRYPITRRVHAEIRVKLDERQEKSCPGVP